MDRYLPFAGEHNLGDASTQLLGNGISGDNFGSHGSEDQMRLSSSHGQSNLSMTSTLSEALSRLVYKGCRILVPRREATGCEDRAESWFSSINRLTGIRAVLVALRPDILAPARKRKTFPTSWLDGLRGIAAFVVVIYHNCQVFYGGSCEPWYKENPHFFRLPIVRLQCTGTAMVDIFFVVSGYALSYKPLSIARTNDFPRLASSLASSVFRRGIRLYIPVVAITLLNALASYLQLFDPEGRGHVPHLQDFWATMTCWLNDLLTGLNPFNIDKYKSWDMPGLRYEPAMWTIPYEYRGSMIVFLMLLVLGRIRGLPGFVLLLTTVFYVLAIGQWDIFLFLSGVLCCQVHHYLESRQSTHLATQVDIKSRQQDGLRSILDRVNSICGLFIILYVVTIPDYHFGLGDIPFYSTIVKADPSTWAGLPDTGRFPVCIATALLVFYLGQSKLFRDLLSTRFPQYLGENSFAIYLIHFFLINTMGRPLMRGLYACKDTFGWAEGLRAVLGDWLVLALYSAIAVPVLFWSGEIITRYVDKKSVELARWAEQRCMGSRAN